MLKLTCPNCNYQTDFLSALTDNEQREFIRMLIKEIPSGQHSLIMRYLTMFKPLKNAQSFQALNARLVSLLELVKSGRVTQAGNVRVAPQEMWFAALEHFVVNKPDSVKLPLKHHKYLISIVFNQCESAEAAREAKQIEKARNRPRGPEHDIEHVVQQNKQRDDDAGMAGLNSLKNLLPSTKA